MNSPKHIALLACLLSSTTLAAESENPFYIGIDYTQFYSDNDRILERSPFANVDDGNGLGAHIGYDFSELFGIRFGIKDIDAESEGLNAYDVGGKIWGLDALYSPFEAPVYFSAGLNQLDFEDNHTAVSLGIGLRHQLYKRLSAYAEAKKYFAFSDSLNNDTTITVGLSYHFGEPARSSRPDPDHDNDGVPNHLDQCPNSPPNAKVDSVGCGDSDNDGVSNLNDACPNSPAGAKVNRKGCADSDNDGVIDANDQCPNSARGATVNAQGCADDDNDGVNNKDDLCPDTQPGVKVGKTGCEEGREAIELAILFDNNSSDIKSTYNADIERVAAYMNKYSEVRVEIIGHTSSVGDSAYNQTLSEQRAAKVAQVLINQYGISPDRVSASGVGENQLKYRENTAQAHRLNRRIEAVFN